ncbi:trypsin-like peptidase domain-containing protein [Candidatus Sumerlaeota bacterium]|nr:trypsin-like peptidase domain-containing protein [Candidatus Sumerlaeota bacterium]
MADKSILAITIFITLIIAYPSQQMEAQEAPAAASLMQQLETEVAQIVEQAQTAVVQIKARGKSGDSERSRLRPMPGPGSDQPKSAIGSGFVVDPNGVIVTNSHVIAGMDEIDIVFKNGAEYEAELLGSDPATEVAVLKIESRTPFAVLPIGDSSAVKPGHFAIAIGSPQGLDQTVTLGIISAVNRKGMQVTEYGKFLQTDTSINQGNSGGPLINSRGEAIGVNTFILSSSGGSQGLNFAIPINDAMRIAEQLRESGKVMRGYMGISISDLRKGVADWLGVKTEQGVIVNFVAPGSPADGHLQPYDIITEFNGQPATDKEEVRSAAALAGAGVETVFEFWRDGERSTARFKLGQRPEKTDDGKKDSELPPEIKIYDSGEVDDADLGFGITARPLTIRAASKLGYGGMNGLRVVEIDRDGAAWRAGVRLNMLLQEVNRQPVESVDDFQQAVAAAEAGKPLLLKLRSSNGWIIITLQQNP